MDKKNFKRIKDCLAHLDTRKMEITCLFSNGDISGYGILWPVTGY